MTIYGWVTLAVIIAIIVTEFPNPAERARAMSAYMLVALGGGSLGLLAGGVLTQGVSWHWIFLINIPIGIATFVLGVILIDGNPGLGLGRGVDVTGSLLVTTSLVIGIYASWWMWVHAARSVSVRTEPQPLTAGDYNDRKLEELLQGMAEMGPKSGEKLH